MSKANEQLARECLKRMDEQGDLFALLTDDVEVFYPKWGVASGKTGYMAMLQDLGSYLSHIKHDFDSMKVISQGDTVVIEGVSSGGLVNGLTYAPDGGAAGRFCSVFQISGDMVARIFVYLDPDHCDQSNIHPWRKKGEE